MEQKNHLLIIGEHNTGKTIYRGQLYKRLEAHKGALHLHSAPKDLSPFRDALKRLAQGQNPEHTPSQVYHEITLTVSLPGRRIADIVWPDYGGEQITEMITKQRVNTLWLKRLSESDSWLLFIRLNRLTIDNSFLTTSATVSTLSTINRDEPEEHREPSAIAMIELLQMFLYLKGVGTIERVTTPSLSVFLSCWDEMDEEAQTKRPAELLEDYLPFFSTFINTIWHPDHLSIWGLSSTGKRLNAEQPDEAYMDDGPQEFGYIVQPDGIQSDDLSLPLFKLLESFR